MMGKSCFSKHFAHKLLNRCTCFMVWQCSLMTCKILNLLHSALNSHFANVLLELNSSIYAIIMSFVVIFPTVICIIAEHTLHTLQGNIAAGEPADPMEVVFRMFSDFIYKA